MKWQRIEGIRGAFEAVIGRTVVRRTSDYADLPTNDQGFGYGDDMEAVAFDDGSWLVIEYDHGEPDYSDVTPGSPGFTYVWLGTPV